MSDAYTKLFSSITASTIVSEPVATRWLWVTMLAMADQNGDVWGSIPGLARHANLSIEETETGLRRFQEPDRYSRTQDSDGRRVEIIDGGWHLINHGKYRKIRSKEERREYMREYMREKRAGGDGKQLLADLAELAPPAPAPAPSKAKTLVQQAARFDEFWAAFPSRPGTSKSNKKGALAKWKARKLDSVADLILADIDLRKRLDKRWLDGFCPDPCTYLNQDRWNDDKPAQGPSVATAGHSPARESETPRQRAEQAARSFHHMGRITDGQLQAELTRITEKYGAQR